jgi:general secretion pathway protein G
MRQKGVSIVKNDVMSRGVGVVGGRARRRAGFTLIELLIVIAIIVAIGGLVTVSLVGRKKEANAQLAQQDINTLKQALRMFNVTYDRYPTDEEGVEVLWDKEKLDPDADAAKWKKFLEEPMASDRWGSPWGYRQVSEHGDQDTFDLWSPGPDKQEGTEDDVKTWKDDAEGMPSDASGGGSNSGGGTGSGG